MKKRSILALCMAFCLMALTACDKDSSKANTDGVTEAVTEAAKEESGNETPETTAEATPEAAAETTPEAGSDSTESSDKEGVIDGSTYSNAYYNFDITIPDTWVLYDHDTTLQTMYASMGAIYEDVDAMKKSYEQMGIDYLFYGMDSQISAEGTSNVLCQVIPTSMLGGLSLSDFIDQTAEASMAQYEQLGGVTTIGEPQSVTISGKDGYSMELATVLNGTISGVEVTDMHIYQKYIIAEENDVVLIFLTTVYNEDNKEVGDQILSTIEFSN